MKKCLFCGKEFEPNAWNQQYCSDKCKRSIRTHCAHCGKEIVHFKNKSGVYFCSRKCASFYSGKTILRECATCGRTFETKKSAIKYGHGKYCSKRCADKAKEVVRRKVCPQCGKEYVADKINGRTQKYCSKNCMKAAFSKPIDKELLQKLYVDEELTSREVGEIVGRSKKIVLDYLKRYGIEVRPDGLKSRDRINYKDGHKVRSYYERAFDNALFSHGIEHEYDPRLPFNRRYMADFKVGDIYVEIWGMMGIKEYRENRERKLTMYHDNECKLLEVFPEDFKNINNKINELKSLMVS